MIEVENLKKYFGKTKAVDDITFNVGKGEIFGFLGPNGAGKTTTIRCMLDFIRPDSGSIRIDNLDAQKDSVKLKKKIGYLSGYVSLYKKWNGRDHIEFIRALDKKTDISGKIAARFAFNQEIKARQLSSGNRQKLAIIMAFMTQPEVLIMDEPTNALDPLLQNEMYDLIKEVAAGGTTVFMSSHNLAEIERICSRVGIIKEGKMVAVENMAGLKDKKIYTVNVSFKEQVDPDKLADYNSEIMEQRGDGLILKIKGDIDPVMKRINLYSIKDISITHASLEDIFLEYYGK